MRTGKSGRNDLALQNRILHRGNVSAKAARSVRRKAKKGNGVRSARSTKSPHLTNTVCV